MVFVAGERNRVPEEAHLARLNAFRPKLSAFATAIFFLFFSFFYTWYLLKEDGLIT